MFICDSCELESVQSPMWEECCVPCNIAMLTTDLERLIRFSNGETW